MAVSQIENECDQESYSEFSRMCPNGRKGVEKLTKFASKFAFCNVPIECHRIVIKFVGSNTGLAMKVVKYLSFDFGDGIFSTMCLTYI